MEYLVGVIGGLGLFIFGIQMMAEGLQKAAGDSLKKILEILTTNPFIAVITGVIVTVLVQSSTTATVMMVGFVNAGLMSLTQAVGVIFGVNIGTTVTAQLISFRLGELALPAIGIGFATMSFCKRRIYKYIGQSILGFGLLFLGLSVMSGTLKPLQYNEAFREILASFGTNPFLGIIVGALFTIAVQSSSATTGVIVALSLEGLIDLRPAMALVLGTNIGTCITAILASVGASITAKRAAFAHMLFNIIGSILFLILLNPFVDLVSMTAPSHQVTRQIANGHTIFNVANTILFLPFINKFTKLVIKLVPGEDTEVKMGLQFVDQSLIKTPSAALSAADKEVYRMGSIVCNMVEKATQNLKKYDEKITQNVLYKENMIDNLEKEMTQFLVDLSQASTRHSDSLHITGLLHVLNDLERIGDHSENIIELSQAKMENKLPFSESAIQELNLMHKNVNEILNNAMDAYNRKDKDLAALVIQKDREIDELEKELRKRHTSRINQRKCKPTSGVLYLDVLSNYERIADHATNIAEIVRGEF